MRVRVRVRVGVRADLAAATKNLVSMVVTGGLGRGGVP